MVQEHATYNYPSGKHDVLKSKPQTDIVWPWDLLIVIANVILIVNWSYLNCIDTSVSWVGKNIDSWITKNNGKTKRENLAYDVKVIYFKISFGQKFVDYLGPIYFNSMPNITKKNIKNKHKNVKKTVNDWLILSMGLLYNMFYSILSVILLFVFILFNYYL
jgi:hypothetical protein